MKLRLIRGTDDHYFIEGDLTIFTINKKTINLLDFIGKKKEVFINLKKIESVDSAGLALIIEWIKFSRSHNTCLFFCCLPDQLKILADLSGFDMDEYLYEPLENSHD